MTIQLVHKVLVPVDFSPHSRLALTWAADLARRLDARLVLLHVSEPVVFVSDDGTALMNEAAQTAAMAHQEEELCAWRREVEAAGAVSIETEVVEGKPEVEILRAARRGGFDLIVMGSHGRTGFRRAILGSVAEKVVRGASCPVLTVRLPGSRSARHEVQADAS